MVEVYGEAFCGSRRCQSFASRPRSAMASMSPASASVTTSAGRPSATESACLPEPPCDISMVRLSPCCAFHCAAKAAFTSR